MKDSQQRFSFILQRFKYIKANNERFSTVDGESAGRG